MFGAARLRYLTNTADGVSIDSIGAAAANAGDGRFGCENYPFRVAY